MGSLGSSRRLIFIGSARQYASDHVPEALRTIVELMRSAKSEKVRLDATSTLTRCHSFLTHGLDM